MEILRHTSSEAQIRSLAVAPPLAVAPKLDLEDFYCILQIQPHDSFIARELAKRLESLDRLDEAAKVLHSVLKIDSCFATLFALGQLQYRREKLDEALLHLQSAALIAPENSTEMFELFKTLGNIYVRKNEFDLAEDNYNRAYRLRPESDVLHVNFAALHMQRQQWEDALGKYRRALELNSRNDKAWVGLALCHRLRGDLELAWGNLEAALEYNPLNEVALGLALDWAAQQGREFRALELIRQFLTRGGWNEKMSLAFAWLSWRRGEKPVACLELERLLAVNPANAAALGLLAEMRCKM